MANQMQPGDVIGMDKQAVADGEYAASYYTGDPRMNATVPYPITCGDLNSLIRNGGRIDPNVNTVRRKGAKIGSQTSQLLVDQDSRILSPVNNPYGQYTMQCSQSLPGMFLDTRRGTAGMQLIKPYSIG